MRSRLFCLLMIVAVCASAHAYDWSTNPGKGWSSDPYQISEPNQLMAIGSDSELLSRCFILTDDIIFDPNNNPAHRFTAALIAADSEFRGYFDGNGYRIVNLTINGGDNVGLFGTVSYSLYFDYFFATIKNLTLDNVNISGGYQVGAICGMNDSTMLDNCTVSGTVSGGERIGGLCGMNYSGTIQNSSGRCTVSGYIDVGGLCGRNEGWPTSDGIIFCSAAGAVMAEGGQRVGGLCGYNNGRIMYCYADGTVSGFGLEIGGFCGWNRGQVSICYALGDVSIEGSEIGGFCGVNFEYPGNLITRCYAAGDVEGTSNVGGFCGENMGTISRSCANGSVTGYLKTGGFCGRHWGLSISECYSSGVVTGPLSETGGFIGECEAPLENCFWDTQNSGRISGVASMNPDPSGITGLITSQMQQQSTFTDSGWDFVGEIANGTEEVWYMQDYPALQWKRRIMGNGDGSQQNPYVIEDSVDFVDFCQDIKYWNTGVYTRLDCDLDLSYIDTLLPIGYSYIDPDYRMGVRYITYPYQGHFDGNHHVLSRLTLDYANNNGQPPTNRYLVSTCGLFNLIGPGGTVVNLGIRDVDITNNYSASAPLCNVNDGGTIQNCYCVGGTVKGASAGGLCVKNDGTISHCFSSVQVTGTDSTAGFCLTGSNGAINDSFWDVQVAGVGTEGDNEYGAMGKTTQQMKTRSTFTDAGWDFVSHIIEKGTWRMCVDGLNYPRFSGASSREGDLTCPDGVGFEDLEALSQCWLKEIDLVTELDDDSDTIVSLAEIARVGEYWISSWNPGISLCGECGGVDFNRDGKVMLEDLEMIVDDWLREVFPACTPCDVTGDKMIDLNDFRVLTENWQ